jgi:hypothetical protein
MSTQNELVSGKNGFSFDVSKRTKLVSEKNEPHMGLVLMKLQDELTGFGLMSTWNGNCVFSSYT